MNCKSFKIRGVLALSFALVVTLAIIFTAASIHGIVRADASPTITSDQPDYQPGATVTLTGAGWASGEAVHINVDDSVNNTWSLDSDPDPVADSNGGFTYQFSLPSTVIANYAVTATGTNSDTATTTFTDAPCPKGGTANRLTDNNVGASYTTSGNTATYTFSSFTNESPSGGIPGLIDYCVYTSPLPDSNTTVAVGANGGAWGYNSNTDNFSFGRPNGDPSNIELNGTTGIEMGTATWSGGIPTSQTIVLHINDPAECSALYGSGTKTCFVLPGKQQAEDLTVSKTAQAGFSRDYNWKITKSVDKTLVEQIGGTATFNYTVAVIQVTNDKGWHVQGQITVANPNNFDFTGVNVTDAVDDGGTCAVTGGTNVTVPAGSSVILNYICSYSSQPTYNVTATNTATATWDSTSFNTPDSSASGHASFTFADGSYNNPKASGNKTVTVTDTFNGTTTTLDTLTAKDTPPFVSATYNYSHTINVPSSNCVTYTNTASLVEAKKSSNRTVEVCGPANTGALTIGFWKSTNGQSIITGQANSGPCPSAAWLTQYNPFMDLSNNADCSTTATYVSNIITASTTSGSSMNARLKAQMLATALNVYFSDPSLGGNLINAPAPIGSVKIDLQKICKIADSSSGTGSCGGSYYKVNNTFGGAKSLTVLQMLNYAASQSNSDGSTWYGNVKATQQQAKDAFDSINNQVAFAP